MFGSAAGNTITGNTLRNNPIGIKLWISGEGGPAISWGTNASTSPQVRNNKIYDNTLYGAKSYNKEGFTPIEMDAEHNWWGTTVGNTIASQISGLVDYRPWCTELTCTDEDFDAPSVIEGSLSPVKSAVGVALDATISLAFSEKVSIGSVVVKNNTTSVETTISGSGISFNDTTNTATITLPAETLQSNTTYVVTVNNIQDPSGNNIDSYAPDWRFTTATGYSINLISGWNLISLPVTPTTWRSIPNTLATVSGKVNRIWTYDAPNAKWLVYNTDLSVPSDTNFTSLEAGRGYWIEMNAGGVLVGSGTLYEQLVPSGEQPSNQLPQVQLAKGWNMIGYYQLPGKTDSPIANALVKLDGDWSGTATGLSGDLLTFTSNPLQVQTPISTMVVGKGYWIYMKSASMYSFGN